MVAQLSTQPAATPSVYRAGYASGYRSGVDALAVMLCDPQISAAEALRRADDHLVSRLYGWHEDGGPGAPPPFHRPTAATLIDDVAAGAPFATGYLEGWDSALAHFQLLVGRYGTPRFTAIDVLRDHARDALSPWSTMLDAEDSTAPALRLPTFINGHAVPRTL